VVNPDISEIEKDIEIFVYNYLINKRSINNKELVSVSIRVSYKSSHNSKHIYAVLLETDFKAINLDLIEVMDLIKTRIESRSIRIKTITSFHLHLYYN
jgi:hypothetical protein